MSSLKVSIPKGSTVLVTGATGFLASHIIRKFLERGYKVRGTVRDLAQASWLVDDNHFKSWAESGHLELVVVPDLSANGAFNEAVKGVSAIAHVAAVTTLDPNPENVIPQTVAGTTSILAAAAEQPSVREFVYTSSFLAAILPFDPEDATKVDRNTWNEAAVQAAWAPPPYEPSRAMFTYAASKVAAEKAVWEFSEEKKPHFTINVVAPAGMTGEALHRKHVDHSGNLVASLYQGDKAKLEQLEAMFAGLFVDVQDIANLHVASILDPEVKDTRIQAWGRSANWNDILAILRELRRQKEFVPDYPKNYYLSVSTDETDTLALLKKWAGQEGWKPLRDSIAETIENPYF